MSNNATLSNTQHELWFTRVFLGEHIQGNITPVLITDITIASQKCQQIANSLVMSDTAFIFNSKPSLPTLYSFSPYEELNFCVQILLAAASV